MKLISHTEAAYRAHVLSVAAAKAKASSCMVLIDDQRGLYFPVDQEHHAEIQLLDHEDIKSA